MVDYKENLNLYQEEQSNNNCREISTSDSSARGNLVAIGSCTNLVPPCSVLAQYKHSTILFPRVMVHLLNPCSLVDTSEIGSPVAEREAGAASIAVMAQ